MNLPYNTRIVEVVNRWVCALLVEWHTLRLYDEFVASVREAGLPLARVLPCYTCNTAAALHLPGKGCLQVGADGDVLVVRKVTLELIHVVARGRLLRDGAFVPSEAAEPAQIGE